MALDDHHLSDLQRLCYLCMYTQTRGTPASTVRTALDRAMSAPAQAAGRVTVRTRRTRRDMSGWTILAASDDPAVRSLLVQALTLEGYQVYSSGGAGDLMYLARARQPQLILIDIAGGLARRGPAGGWAAVMAATLGESDLAATRRRESDLIGACWQLRSDPSTRRLPILALVADHAEPLLPVRARLIKPFDLEDLNRAIQCCLVTAQSEAMRPRERRARRPANAHPSPVREVPGMPSW